MARVKIQSIIEQRDYEIKRALEDALSRVLPEVQFDRARLYKEFCKAVGRKASIWVDVADTNVEKRCSKCGGLI
ncbi:MAG: hypothetical protein R3F45_12025 [Gammaproteobacteria bacterium]